MHLLPIAVLKAVMFAAALPILSGPAFKGECGEDSRCVPLAVGAPGAVGKLFYADGGKVEVWQECNGLAGLQRQGFLSLGVGSDCALLR